jgi:hypothetical protein
MPRPLYTQERTHDTHWIGGWVGPRADLEAVARRKKSQPLSQIENRGGPARSLIIIPTELPQIKHILLFSMMMMMIITIIRCYVLNFLFKTPINDPSPLCTEVQSEEVKYCSVY